ncbi:MAG: LysR family transcriptional regulator [Alphaproteobacteria bacterium]|nr:LysR family transcriptional regulator [Alphaproteobacteria bacterium]
MTLNQLKILCAVVDKGGFRAAAETLHRSQSAISLAIRKLEEELDLSLFSRDGYRPQLTAEGRTIYDKAQTVLSKSEELTTLAHRYSLGEEPELRLAISAMIPIDPILDVLNQMALQAPATRLTLLFENLLGTMERLDDGDVDIAISEMIEDQATYDFVSLNPVELTCVISPKSELAARAAELKEVDMEGSTQVIVRDTSRRASETSFGVLETITPWVVNDFAMKKRIIVAGLGWGRLPRHLVEDEINSGELLVITSDDFLPILYPVKMARRKNRLIGSVEAKLWTLITEKLRQISPLL